jgi:FtsH-binding integral membrane protein
MLLLFNNVITTNIYLALVVLETILLLLLPVAMMSNYNAALIFYSWLNFVEHPRSFAITLIVANIAVLMTFLVYVVLFFLVKY